MKKLLILFMALLATSICVYADEEISVPTQIIEIEKSGAVAILQKQPTAENQNQVIRIKKSGGFLLIQINGKVKDIDTTIQNRK